MSGLSVIITLFVLSPQVFYFLYCRAILRRVDHESLSELFSLFERDIIERAKRGHLPDWLRYADETDRIAQKPGDALRNYATAALATGIGGTMLALALNLVLVGPLAASKQQFGLDQLMVAMGWAVVASFLGVANHLYILLTLVPAAEARAAETSRSFRIRLQHVSDGHLPQETLTDAIRTGLADALKDVVEEIPKAFNKFDKTVMGLGEIITGQSETIVTATRGLSETADRLEQASGSFRPAAEALVDATGKLSSIPSQLAEVLDRSREMWASDVDRIQQVFLAGVKELLSGQLKLLIDTQQAFEKWEAERRDSAFRQEEKTREAIREVQNSTADVINAVNTLPAMFSKYVEDIGHTLGQRFGSEARLHVNDLTAVLLEENRRLQDSISRQSANLENLFLSRTGEVVGETLTRVYQRIDATLLTSLDELGRGLRDALTELPENARSFAASLAMADGKLESALAGIQRSANHLEQAARVPAEFQNSLALAVREATGQHLNSFDPLRKQMATFIAGFTQTQTQLNRTLDTQAAFIRDLIQRFIEEERAS